MSGSFAFLTSGFRPESLNRERLDIDVQVPFTSILRCERNKHFAQDAEYVCSANFSEGLSASMTFLNPLR
jgi:hypothetical protein